MPILFSNSGSGCQANFRDFPELWQLGRVVRQREMRHYTATKHTSQLRGVLLEPFDNQRLLSDQHLEN